MSQCKEKDGKVVCATSEGSSCSHDVYIEVTGKTKDRCWIDLRQQPAVSDRKFPLEERPHQAVFVPQNEDSLLLRNEGYPPKVKGLGSCDSLTFRVCINCHQVLGMQRLTLDEWKHELRERTGDTDDECEREDDTHSQ